MNLGKEIISVHQDANEVAHWVVDALTKVGFHIESSFNLQSACAPHRSPCPHHGTIPCSCQLIVLMVYDWGSQAHTMTIHGCDKRSQIGFVESSEHPLGKPIEELLFLALEADMRFEMA